MSRNRRLRQRHRQGQKEAPHAEAPLRPLPTTNRLPLHVATAHPNSGTRSARRAPCKIPTSQCHLSRRWPVSTPSTASSISQPIIPQPRCGSLRLRFCKPFLFAISTNYSWTCWHVGRSSQRVPIRPRRRLPAPPRRLNARRTSPSSQRPPPTNHRSDIPPYKNRSGRPLRIVPMLNNV